MAFDEVIGRETLIYGQALKGNLLQTALVRRPAPDLKSGAFLWRECAFMALGGIKSLSGQKSHKLNRRLMIFPLSHLYKG